MEPLDELRFLVTGSASGIGLAVTSTLARAGARVLATDIAEERLAQRADEGRWPATVERLRHDIADAASWGRVLDVADERWRGLDVVLNIAGYLKAGYVHEFEVAEVDRHFDINTKGVVYGTRLPAARWIEQGRKGHIVNVASMAAFAPVPGISLYSASKYAVRAFSIAAAAELRPAGIAVTVLCPDPVDTPMLDGQRDTKEAAITFSAPRVLTTTEVSEQILGAVLRKRPVEVAMPRSRKWIAKTADLWPALGVRLVPLFRHLGRKRQQSK